MREINIGVVGCGWAGMKHLNSLAKMEGVTVISLATANEQRIREAQAIFPGARTYQRAEEMIEAERTLDAVVLCVTPSRHDGLEQLCAGKGIHMYIEKPLETNLARAEAIERAIERAGVIVSVGYQERYNPALAWAFAFLEGREVRFIEAHWFGHMVTSAKWWRTKAESGGQIIEQSTHLFDMIRFLAGEGRVVGATATAAPAPGPLANDVEPASVTLLKMDSGAVGQVTTACFLDPKMAGRIGITIWCSDGRVEYDWSRGQVRTVEDCHKEFFSEPDSHHSRALGAFVEAVRTGERLLVLSDYGDAMRTFRMTAEAQTMIDKERGSEMGVQRA